MPEATPNKLRKLTFYKTSNKIEDFAEFDSVDQFFKLKRNAQQRGKKVFILGNGSNTFFARSNIKCFVLKNAIPGAITVDPTNDEIIEAASSTLVSRVLKQCFREQRNAFYYMASVPATVGGAIAMNAGRGRNLDLTVFDFLESVVVTKGFDIVELRASEIPRDYRWTCFTGVKDELIVSAKFRFPKLLKPLETNPIRERILWSKKNQDHSAPNCGSVFKEYDQATMSRLKRLSVFSASYSGKTLNWILNKSTSPIPIRLLILIAKASHWIRRKNCQLEIIEVE